MYRSFHLLIILIAIALLPYYGGVPVSPVWAETGEENPHPRYKSREIMELEKFRSDIQRWFDAQKEKRAHQLHDILDLKIFQTHVFFGTGMAIFLVLTALFVGKFLFNIVRDAGVAFYEKILSLKGYNTAKAGKYHFAPLMTACASNEARPGVRKTAGATSKKFLFCEVMTQFVNPLIKPDFIHKALAEQAERNPRPKIGSLLIEYQVVSQQDVDKTLKLQYQYRSQK